MRGEDRQQGAMFSYLSPEQRVPRDHPLRAIREIVDAVLGELSPEFARLYAENGRPSIAPEKLLPALLLQVLYTIRSKRLSISPRDHGILEEPSQIFGAGRTWRELRDAMLRQCAFDKRGDVCGLIAQFPQPVRNLQIPHD